MPVIQTSNQHMSADNRPPWCTVTNAGIFMVPAEGGRFDRHYHDYNEYWLIFKGKAKIMSEDQAYYVKSGDIVCTKAGDEHDILEVYEDLEAFWFAEATPANGRIGHLHRDDEKAKGHPIPVCALPADFPE